MVPLPLPLLLACQPKDTPTPPPTDAPTTGAETIPTDAPPTDTEPPDGPALTERPANPTCFAPERPVVEGDITLVRAFPNLTFPEATEALQPPGDPDTWWVVLQEGRIVRFRDDPLVSTTSEVLDITGRVNNEENEMGLLSVAFHPDWATNHEVVVSYTAGTLPDDMHSVVARYRSTDGGLTLDPASEEVVLTLDQPYKNHNGGLAAFGPDGLLYLGFGDGGSGGDPHGNGQNKDVLLGKILRIDVDHGSPYAIPADNPFASGGGRPEIYAYGLRNPWRFSFDPATGDLWVGDVGQTLIEEVDLVRRGGNYGWNVMEGDSCYEALVCDRAGLELPVATMRHSEGHECVTGGVVYRGTAIPGLVGRYVWADYLSGTVFGLATDPITGEWRREVLYEAPVGPTHIGVDAEGEIVLVSRNDGMFRVVPAGKPGPSTFPATLAETGCFDAAGQPLPMLVPFEVAHPFWSDGADKARWLAIPDGTTMSVDDQGRLVAPVGSVLVKEFTASGRKVETRLLVRHEDGLWAGYAYAWDEAGTAAALLPGAQVVEGGRGEDWRVPSRAECLRCHTSVAGGALGLRLDQLDLEATQPNGWVENQVDELVRLGMLDPPSARPGHLVALDDTSASDEQRARTWLDVNCSFCHRPGGTGGGSLDLRLSTPLAQTGMCDAPVAGDLGITNARIVAPGAPQTSVLSARIRRRDAWQMPPLATTVVDEQGARVVDEWITGLGSCP